MVKLVGCSVIVLGYFKKSLLVNMGPQIGVDVFAHVWTQAWQGQAVSLAGSEVGKGCKQPFQSSFHTFPPHICLVSFISVIGVAILPVFQVQV